MRYLEIQFYEKCKSEFGVKNRKHIEENCYRFLEDCYTALDATSINPLKPFFISFITFVTILNLPWSKTTSI